MLAGSSWTQHHSWQRRYFLISAASCASGVGVKLFQANQGDVGFLQIAAPLGQFVVELAAAKRGFCGAPLGFSGSPSTS